MKCQKLSRTAGIKSVSLVTVLLLFNVLATSAWADTGLGQMHFTVAAMSEGRTTENFQHRMLLNGDGKFEPGHVEGGGTFVIFNNAPAGTPKPLQGFGRWKAKKVVSY